MQQKLNIVAGSYPSISKVTADGIFGPTTEKAVKAFESLFDLIPDGVVGAETWNKIVSVSDELPSAPSLPSYPGYYISTGSWGSYVQMIQQRLNALSGAYPSIPKISADGNFGAGTKKAVQAFQKTFGLPQDGIVGRSTWDRILSESAKIRV
jgi:peptidoglycan hydrolase-like protein with peptidoglycan-binding domain